MAWHGDPGLLRRDGYSADYGVGFYGHWRNAGAYLSCSAPLGWLCVFHSGSWNCEASTYAKDCSTSLRSDARATILAAHAHEIAGAFFDGGRTFSNL